MLDLHAGGPSARGTQPIAVEVLEETRKTADRELTSHHNRQEQIRQLEEDKEALLENYAGLVPDALDAPERHRVYKMLRVEVAIVADGSLEVSGDVMSVCEMEALST